MVSIGNKAKLVNSDFCQHCAKCCKVFILEGIDFDPALRFLWMKEKKIKARESIFREPWGDKHREAVFKFPCSKLTENNGKFSCSVWDKERPDFCNTYPDNYFYGIETWDTIKIEKTLEEKNRDCPGLKRVTVEQVQDMLTKHRKNEE